MRSPRTCRSCFRLRARDSSLMQCCPAESSVIIVMVVPLEEEYLIGYPVALLPVPRPPPAFRRKSRLDAG